MTNALLNNLANELESYTEDSDISVIYEKKFEVTLSAKFFMTILGYFLVYIFSWPILVYVFS